MEIDIDDIDFVSLRNDLIDYFGSATPFYGIAMADVVKVENASNLELLNIINETTLDITDYINNNLSK